MFSRFKTIIKSTIQYACVMHCTFQYVGDFVVCNGASMEPTLYTNNVLVTNRISARLNKYERGDLIIAVSPVNPKQYICKRIVGVPGDTINKKKITNFTNENEYEYLNNTTFRHFNTYTHIPNGYVWIEGDNKSNSSDSRYYGPIPLGLIKSRVVCRIWPLTEICML